MVSTVSLCAKTPNDAIYSNKNKGSMVNTLLKYIKHVTTVHYDLHYNSNFAQLKNKF